MRVLKTGWAVLAVLMLAGGAMLAGGRMAWSWKDLHEYAGIDLANRLGACRTIDEGLNPYTTRNSSYGQPVPPQPIHRWNEHPYTPALIWAYVPLGRLTFATAREVDFWLEWGGLVLAVFGIAIAFGRVDAWAWAGVAFAVVVNQFSWRLHVERGQSYVFLTAMAGTGLALLSRADRGKGWRVARAAGAVLIGAAAAVRPTLGLLLVLLPLCGAWRAAIVGIGAAVAVVGLTLLPGQGGYWADYLDVVNRVEEYGLNLGDIEDPLASPPTQRDPTLADAYQTRAVRRGILSCAGPIVANDWLWPSVHERYGRPTREAFPVWSRRAAAGWAALSFMLVGLLWLRGSTPLDRLAVASAMTVAIDFFLPLRYEYADVLYLIPLGLCLAALRGRRAVVLPIVLVAGLGWTVQDVQSPVDPRNSPLVMWRPAMMVLLPVVAVAGTVLVLGKKRTGPTPAPTKGESDEAVDRDPGLQ